MQRITDLVQLPIVLPPVWSDRMELSIRTDTPLATLRFSAVVPPNALIETARVQTNIEQLKKMVDVISRNINYYPGKEDVGNAKSL